MATVRVGVSLSFTSVLLDSFSPALPPSSRPSPLPARAPLRLQWSRIEAKKEPTRCEPIEIRHARNRKKLNGTTERPHLAVFRSNQHMYVQVIDDTKGFTLASASTIQKNLLDKLNLSAGPTIDAVKRIGEEIAKACLAKGITKVAFDRGGFVYHGHIKALADSARGAWFGFLNCPVCLIQILRLHAAEWKF